MAASDPLRYVKFLYLGSSKKKIGLTIILKAAHMCTADDEYDGYFIPKGTLVLGNTWSVSPWPIYDRPSF